MEEALVLKERGNEHFRSGRPRVARELYVAALDALSSLSEDLSSSSPSSSLRFQILGNLAAVDLKLNCFADVNKETTTVIESAEDFSDVKLLFRRYKARFALGHYVLALEDAKQCVRLLSTEKVFRNEVAICSRYVREESLLKRLVELELQSIEEIEPLHREFFLEEVTTLGKLRKKRSAVQAYENLVSRPNVHEESLVQYGLRSIKQGDDCLYQDRSFVDAAESYLRGVSILLHFRKVRFERAEETMSEEVVEIDQAFGSALANIGNMFALMEFHDEAVDLYQRGLKVAKELGDVGVVVTLLRTQGLAIARGAYSRPGLRLRLAFEKEGSLFLSQASQLLESGEGPAAIIGKAWVLEARAEGLYRSRLVDASIDTRLLVPVESQDRSDRDAKCLEFLSEAEEINRTQDQLRRARGILSLRVICLAEMTQYQECLVAYERAVACQPADNDEERETDTLIAVATAHLELDDWKTALRMAKRGLKLESQIRDSVARAHRSFCFWRKVAKNFDRRGRIAHILCRIMLLAGDVDVKVPAKLQKALSFATQALGHFYASARYYCRFSCPSSLTRYLLQVAGLAADQVRSSRLVNSASHFVDGLHIHRTCVEVLKVGVENFSREAILERLLTALRFGSGSRSPPPVAVAHLGVVRESLYACVFEENWPEPSLLEHSPMPAAELFEQIREVVCRHASGRVRICANSEGFADFAESLRSAREEAEDPFALEWV